MADVLVGRTSFNADYLANITFEQALKHYSKPEEVVKQAWEKVNGKVKKKTKPKKKDTPKEDK